MRRRADIYDPKTTDDECGMLCEGHNNLEGQGVILKSPKKINELNIFTVHSKSPKLAYKNRLYIQPTVKSRT